MREGAMNNARRSSTQCNYRKAEYRWVIRKRRLLHLLMKNCSLSLTSKISSTMHFPPLTRCPDLGSDLPPDSGPGPGPEIPHLVRVCVCVCVCAVAGVGAGIGTVSAAAGSKTNCWFVEIKR